MEKLPTTRIKKCPRCGNENIISIGTSHITGSGQPMRGSVHFQYICKDCDAEFWYLGESPADS